MKTTRPRPSSRVECLIAGAGGMLGWDLARAFKAAYGDAGVAALDRRELDIADPAAVDAALARYGPRLVVNAAGYTNVDGAETERDAALRANATGPATLAAACRRERIDLVHFGTDQVFDGHGSRPWTEDDPARPLNHYGATKLAGDRAVLAYEGSLVLRAQWLYGARKDRFTPLREKEVFHPFRDQYGAPTGTEPLARLTVDLVARNARGLFHVAYDDYASWADVYAFVKAELGLHRLRLEPRGTAEAALPAPRPLFAALSNRKLLAFLGKPGMGSWKTPLAEFLRSKR